MALRVLHISDPQFGRLCQAYPIDASEPASVVQHELLTALFAFLSNEPAPDVVVLSGDLTSASTPYEYIQLEAFCAELKRCWPQVPAIFSVPGNHDVCWDISRLQSNPLPDHLKQEPPDARFREIRFAPFCLSMARLCDPATKSFLGTAAGEIVQFSRIADRAWILGFNTAVEDDFDTRPHHGMISHEQLDIADALVRSENVLGDEAIGMLVVHHHLTPMAVPKNGRDYSIAQNAGALLQRCEEWGVDLILHGHRHFPSYKLEMQGSRMFHVMGAGSLATIAQERMDGLVAQCAHFIDVIGRHRGVPYGVCCTFSAGFAGEETRWSRVAHQRNGTGSEYLNERRFGAPCSDEELVEIVEGILGSGEVEVGKEIAANPTLFGCSRESIWECLKRTSEGQGRRAVNGDSSIGEWLVFA